MEDYTGAWPSRRSAARDHQDGDAERKVGPPEQARLHREDAGKERVQGPRRADEVVAPHPAPASEEPHADNGRGEEGVEIADTERTEAGLLCYPAQALSRVAPSVAEDLIVGTPQPRVGGHRADQEPARSQDARHSLKCAPVVLDVLQHIEEKSAVERPCAQRQLIRKRAPKNREPAPASRLQEIRRGLDSHDLAELCGGWQERPAAAADLDQPAPARRERRPQHPAEDRAPSEEPPVVLVLLDVSRNVARVHAG